MPECCALDPPGSISIAPRCLPTITIISPPIAAARFSDRRNSKRSSYPAPRVRLFVTSPNWLTPAGAGAKRLQQHDVKKKKTKYGHGEAWGALNNLNWRSTDISPAHIEGFTDNDVVLRPCFQCARMCPWDAKIGAGEFKGTVVHFNAGGEWLDTFFNLGIKGNSVLYLAEKINNLGIECSHFSCGAGVAFEAWEKGMLGPDKTDGLKLEWGNVEAVDKLLDMAARREGWLGNLLAEGPKQLAEAIGGDAPQLGGAHQRRNTGDARVASVAGPDASRIGRQRRHEAAGRRLDQASSRSALQRDLGARWKWTSRMAGPGHMCCRSSIASSPASSAAAGSRR